MIDRAKRNDLVTRLQHEPEPQLVRIETFFDGNNDAASIGCNLIDHPGIDTFRSVLMQVAGRPDVEAVYARISEVDPGEDSWPFSDMVFVVGAIESAVLADELAALRPDEVGLPPPSLIPGTLLGNRLLMAWWD